MIKKISISILTLLCIVMSTHAKNPTPEVHLLNNQTDSMNYAFGLYLGANIRTYKLPSTDSNMAINEFMLALQNGFEGKVEPLSDIAEIGKNIGQTIRDYKNKGLADNPAWTINQKLLLQGFVNGMNHDSTVITFEQASQYFQAQYTASALSIDSVVAGKPVLSTCPNKVKAVKLNTMLDSVNYAFGIINGYEIANHILDTDSTGKMQKELIKYLNLGLKSKVQFPELTSLGESYGSNISQQVATGLLGESSIAVNFQLIQRGCMDGLEQATLWNEDLAYEYIQSTWTNLHYGESKKDNENFLAENALREGVFTTASGLQYEVLNPGKGGLTPNATDKVNVHYHGTLIDGTVFDSSVERGESITFGLNQVILGWTEGLQLMPIGSKYKFYIPQYLGYGSQQAGDITPYSTLIFEVELLDIELENTPENNTRFLTANATKEGVFTTISGLQYEIITQGNGNTPKATDKVNVHYHGTLIDGTVFDSSVERGESITFALNEVIKGWTEGLQLMPEGSKYKFYIPSELAYGNQEVENIPAQSMLIFEIELLDIEIETTPEANAQFLVENATKQGITTTESGLQYEILSLGNGATPAATDTVTIHFEGTLIDGYVFDSSLERDKPITFALDQVIAGWTEGLQLMPVGSKFKLYIPAHLAFDKMCVGTIPPYSTLIYEIELLSSQPNLNPIIAEEVVAEEVTEEVATEEVVAEEVTEEVAAEEGAVATESIEEATTIVEQ